MSRDVVGRLEFNDASQGFGIVPNFALDVKTDNENVKELVIIQTRGKKQVKLIKDCGRLELLTMINGFQWSGQPIDDDIIDLLEIVIDEYRNGRRVVDEAY